MSEALAFDTHRFVKRLVESGLSEKTAEILADEQAHMRDTSLATKQQLADTEAVLRKDLAKLETNLRKDLAKIDADLRKEMAQMETRMLRWIMGALIAQGGIIVSLIKLF
ncbi:MAG: hypothetical protein ACR2OT_04950 [Parvibaculales bacterium]